MNGRWRVVAVRSELHWLVDPRRWFVIAPAGRVSCGFPTWREAYAYADAMARAAA